jgi:hypothetical protein
MARKVSPSQRALKIAVVLYGQQRFSQPNLGIFRTLRILSHNTSEIVVSGHLWTDDRSLGDNEGLAEHNPILSHVEFSNTPLIEHSKPLGQDVYLVNQATSQRRAIEVALQKIAGEPDLVIFTRTDLWISSAESLISAEINDGEVFTSSFHHSGVDDNIAILSWESFQELGQVDFKKALEVAGVRFGEHLRTQVYLQAGLRHLHRVVPYVILRGNRPPTLSLALTWTRLFLRNALPTSLYRFATSPKSELVRLMSKAIQKEPKARI